MNRRRLQGAAIGIVTNDNDPEQTGRIKVRFPWVDDQEESFWCRVAATQGGKSRGNFIRPEVGDEVLVMFERGDANQPWVMGSLWNGQDPPPGPGNPDGHNNDDKFFETRSGHQLIFNDGSDGGYIQFHDSAKKLHTKFDVPGAHIHSTADSGTITITAPEGLVRMECTDFVCKSSKDTTINVANSHTLSVSGTRNYSAKSITQSAGSSMSITTPNLGITCKVFGAAMGGTSASLGSAEATIEPKLEMEYGGAVTRTVAGVSKIKAKSYRTENGGPSGPLTFTAGALMIQADQNMGVQAAGGITLTSASFMVDAGLVSMGKDMQAGKGLDKASMITMLAGSVLLNPSTLTFQCTKSLDVIMGLDFHKVAPIPSVPPVPFPGPFMPHGFVNPILIDTKATVQVNQTPAACAGATAVGPHMPPFLPAPFLPIPTPFRSLMTAAIVAGTLPAVLAAGGLALGLVKAVATGASPQGVLMSGADSPGQAAQMWFMRAFPQFASFGSFIGLLSSLLPYPIANGSISISAPNVLAEDSPMSMGTMPFCNSCSDIPIVPNAMVLASSNVMVGVDLAAVMEQLIYQAIAGGLAMGMTRALTRPAANNPNRAQGGTPDNLRNNAADVPDARNAPARQQCDNPALGHPVDPVSGTLFDKLVDLELPGPMPLKIERNYNSKSGGAGWGGIAGVGWRFSFESYLTLHYRGEKPPRKSKKKGAKNYSNATHFWAMHDPEMRVVKLPYLDEFGEWHYEGPERLEFCRADDDVWDLRDRHGVTFRYQMSKPDEARLVAWFDRHGNTVTVHYPDDSGHAPDGLTDSAGRRIKFIYGAGHDGVARIESFRVTGTEDAWTSVDLRTYHYDDAGRLAATADAVGNTRLYAYDDYGRMIRETEPGGYVWFFHYDPMDRVTETYGQDLHAYCKFDYQPVAQCTVVEDHTGLEETYNYDALGRVVNLLDREGGVEATEFDELGNAVAVANALGDAEEFVYDGQGRMLERVLPTGGKWVYEYDARGWLVSETDPCGGLTRHRHDARGNAIRTKHPDGSETLRRFDPRGLILAEVRPDRSEHQYEYDEAGNLVAEVHDGTRLRHEYDPMGYRLATVAPAGRIRFENDAMGRVLTRQDPDGTTQRYTYSPKGKVAQYTDPAEQVWTVALDPMDRVLERRTPEGSRLATQRGGDALYSAHLDADGRGFRYVHDHQGRLLRHERDDGTTERYERDPAGHLARADYSDGGSRRFINDADGNPVEIRLGDGTRQYIERDALGRWTSAVEETPGRHAERKIITTRDAAGRVIEDSSAHGRTRRRFLPGGLLSRFDVDGAGLTIAHDREGKAKGVQAPDGVYQFRGAQLTTPAGAQVLDGGSDWVIKNAAGALVAAYSTDENERGQRVHERLTIAGTERWANEHRFDRDGRLRERYDGGGNRVLPGVEYGPSQRILRDRNGPVEHDVRGRILARQTVAGIQRLWWDDADRLKEVENPDGTVFRYQYDALSRLVERSADPVDGLITRTTFTWLDNTLTGEKRPDGTHVRYLWVEGEGFTPWAAWLESPWEQGLHLLHADARGAVIAASRSDGSLSWVGEYDAYGSCHHADRGFDQRLRLQGMWADPDTGLYLNRFRWYLPDWGRYVSPDPTGVGGGFNPYAYAGGDPIHRTDPLGLVHDEHGTTPKPDAEPPRTPSTEPPETTAQKRARLQEKFSQRRAEQARQHERAAHQEQVDANRSRRDAGDFDDLPPSERAFIQDDRNLARATDDARALSDDSPSSPIDEARAMDHAERTGQLESPVDRSIQPGADVRSGSGDSEKHHSMKAVVDDLSPGAHEASRGKANNEISRIADERRRGDNSTGMVVDLRHSPDPAADRAHAQAHADQVNKGLVADGHEPIDVSFIEP